MSMSVKKIAELVGENDTRIWRLIQRHVNNSYAVEDYSDVKKIGIDETASKRGHNYVTVFVDMDEAFHLYLHYLFL